MHLASRLKAFAVVGLLSAALALSGCGGGEITQDTVPTEPTPSTTTGGLTTRQAPTPSVLGTPTGPTSEEISPSEVTVGNFELTLVLEPAQHMYDPARQLDTGSDANKNDDNKKDDQPQGIAVLGGLMLKVTNNIDAAQKPKEDGTQGEVLRHVALQVKDKSSGQLVPYLAVSMDALRDGRPALLDHALVPELPDQADVNNLRYGNNVSFPRKGTYQVFIRVEGNPILGAEVPPAAQFNIAFK